ncbi:MAG: aminopeptidase P family protein [Candidatus Methanomethylicota archaeon]|nr:MAG: aminopeptidase P family protein [Candidatus Verstraetearchaeota archaeon]
MSFIFKERCEKAVNILKSRGFKGLLLFPGVNLYYLTGFMIGLSERPTAAIIPFQDEPVLIVPELEKELRGCKTWIKEVEVWREWEDPFKLIAENLSRRGLEREKIGICEKAPWGWVRRIEKLLPNIKFEDSTDTIYSLRMIKENFEVEKIKNACRIVDEALKVGFQSLSEGMSELELSFIIEEEIRRLGGRPAFHIILFGERAALPHGSPGKRKLKRGDVVLVDAGAIIDGYYSDITRTIVYGKPSEKQRRIWNLVYKANRAAFEAIKPGLLCEEADRIARNIIVEGGYGEYFIHRLGHGIGLEGHENPYLVKGNKLKLKAGMTFTIEPGIYISGKLGVRIEDTVLCTPNGCESLTKMERKINP